MATTKPSIKPANPNFSSGPCAKRPGWDISALQNADTGRSHRAKHCKAKLNDVIVKSSKLLGLPEDYTVAIMAGSNTGALEAALWSLLGARGVDILAWENFGRDWVNDILNELKLENVNAHIAEYGDLPNLSKTNFDNDVIFTWNGTTAGVRVPNADWIPDDRAGLTICDATSAVFAMDMDFSKLDVVTWSWQKVLGGEGAHGMIALSPRALERLESHKPAWPMPKVFRMASKLKVSKGIFAGATINTPSMICVEDVLDALNWVESVGGAEALIKHSSKNLQIIADWIDTSDSFKFLCNDESARSSTSITIEIKDESFKSLNEDDQRALVKRIVTLLDSEGVAYDIGGYPKAPPSLRLWGGPTVQNDDMKAVLPWIEWAYQEVK
jgi:phosphoserine aminotransferase